MSDRFYADKPENAPEWFEFGLLVMCRNDEKKEWTGPYVLQDYIHEYKHPFYTDDDAYKYARPAEGIEGEWYDDRKKEGQ
jgi:hypothetical protein